MLENEFLCYSCSLGKFENAPVSAKEKMNPTENGAKFLRMFVPMQSLWKFSTISSLCDFRPKNAKSDADKWMDFGLFVAP